MTTTFTWIPDADVKGTTTPRIVSVKYGDGYEQRAADGLNHIGKMWDVGFTARTFQEINEIEEYLEGLNGVEPFYWTPPRTETAVLVKCASWSRTVGSGPYDGLSATFELLYDLV